MKAEVREELGKVAYEAIVLSLDDSGLTYHARTWNEADPRIREVYRIEAEAVVRHLAALIGVPMLQLLLSEEDVKSLLEQL